MRRATLIPTQAVDLILAWECTLADREHERKEKERLAEIEKAEFWKTVELPDVVPSWMRRYIIRRDIPKEGEGLYIEFAIPGLSRVHHEVWFESGKFVTKNNCFAVVQDGVWQYIQNNLAEVLYLAREQAEKESAA